MHFFADHLSVLFALCGVCSALYTAAVGGEYSAVKINGVKGCVN